ncbi:hypothetical protein ACMG4J_20850 [Rossellomorea marisflavi]|uniref:hypothetical protein n=1 Tax=Rossellomorea marisflavi TaxID=189381 RepID=UPI0039BF1FF2
MINYGEELAYWYLRLNGFFVIDNFVYHRTGNSRDGDADLIALRLPYVKESIGGNLGDWDESLFSHLGEYDVLAILCEVKTGHRANLSRVFENRKVKYTLNRVGFSDIEIKEMLSCNSSSFMLNHNRKILLKLLITEHGTDNQDTFLTFSLEHVEDFIYSRIKKYSNQKYNARHFFPSSLLQYMMYRSNRENR